MQLLASKLHVTAGHPTHTQGAPVQEFPAFLRRPAHLADRNVDAIGGAVLARVPPDRILGASWIGQLCGPDSSVSHFASRRAYGGPCQPSSCCCRDPNGLHAAGFCALLVDSVA